MLSDLEADVLYAFSSAPTCDGIWRLPSKGGPSPRVGVVVRGFRDIPRLFGIPDARFVEWYQRRSSLPAQAVPLVLGDADRARARTRAEERAANTSKVESLPAWTEVPRTAFVLQPPPSKLSQNGTSELPSSKRRRVLLVGAAESLSSRLAALPGVLDVTEVASGWQVLELTESAFDVVLWACVDTPDDAPSEASFLKVLSRTKPDLARVTFFVVDRARRARIERNHPSIAGRFVASTDAELERLLLAR